MEELPRVYYEEMPEGQKRSKFAIAIMVLVLLAMPVGVFLTLRSQNVNSRADTSVSTVVTAETSMKLVSPQSSVNNQAIFPVDVVIRSDQQSTNLFSAHLNFPTDKLEVLAIASNSADLTDQTKQYIATKWIEASYNNESGTVSLVAGVPSPGFQSDGKVQTTPVLATVFFKTRSTGSANIDFQGDNLMLGTDNATNVLTKPQNLVMEVRDSVGDFNDKKYEQIVQNLIPGLPVSTNSSLINPNGGEVYSYYKPVQIKWTNPVATSGGKTNVKKSTPLVLPSVITISLFMNDQFLGQLAQVPSGVQEYVWDITKTLPVAYIRPENSFKIELEHATQDSAEQTEKVLSNGPFAIYLQDTVSFRQPNQNELIGDKVDLNGDSKVDLTDVSYLLSQFLQPVTVTNKKVDLNNDLVINDLDLWYLDQAFKN